MSDPILLRVVRPYSSSEDYLAAEAWTIQSRTMLLIGESPQPAGAAVRFDVVLQNGEKVIRAEGSVVRHLDAVGDRPAGLEVRFKRFGGATKALIDGVLAARSGKRRAARMSMRPELQSIPDTASSRELDSSPIAQPPEPGVTHTELVLARDSSPLSSLLSGEAARGELRRRRMGPVAAPPNRELLLERLRERARGLKKTGASPADSSGHRQYGR